jgi:hypothetical protein
LFNKSLRKIAVPAVLVASIAGIAAIATGCGSSGNSATPFAVAVSDAGAKATFDVPKSIKGGLVEVKLTNKGKAPHSAQFALVKDGHTVDEALKVIQGNSPKTPDWLRAEGGVGSTLPGQTGTATLNLPAGTYALTELGGPGQAGPLASASLEVTSGDDGDLPSTSSTVTAEEKGKDKYAWNISGLKAGNDQITFNAKGKEALHLIAAVRIKDGENPSLAEIKKSFASQKPPSFADLNTFTQSAVLDGGLSQTTTLALKKGNYVFFCPLADRDGGKPHFLEGLLQKVSVK